MERISGFVLGFIVGAIVVTVALKYHVVQADDGIHMVPKLSAQFADAYVDIRGFTLADWDSRRWLALALAQADKSYLLEKSASDSLRHSLDGFVRSLRDSGDR